ncbi:MAG: hypothetical protein HGA44_02090 [Cellulomonadaceae bacterium]|nr:hypothetical protein [Cellulomonadaceae bacterium]
MESDHLESDPALDEPVEHVGAPRDQRVSLDEGCPDIEGELLVRRVGPGTRQGRVQPCIEPDVLHLRDEAGVRQGAREPTTPEPRRTQDRAGVQFRCRARRRSHQPPQDILRCGASEPLLRPGAHQYRGVENQRHALSMTGAGTEPQRFRVPFFRDVRFHPDAGRA